MIWEKLNKPPQLSTPPPSTSNKRPLSSPIFEISALGANSRIFGIGPYLCRMENLKRERGAAPMPLP